MKLRSSVKEALYNVVDMAWSSALGERHCYLRNDAWTLGDKHSFKALVSSRRNNGVFFSFLARSSSVANPLTTHSPNPLHVSH